MVKRRYGDSKIFSAMYLVLIFILAFFLSSIKNHYFVIGKNYIGAENIAVKDFFFIYLVEFWKNYSKNFLCSIIPLIFINLYFVNTIVCFKDSGEKILDFVSISIGLASVFSLIGYYLNLSNIVLHIFSFVFFMLLITLLEYAIKICLKVELGVVFPYTLGITINMYYGICILSMPHSYANIIPLFILTVVIYLIRFVSAVLIKKREWHTKLGLLLGVIIISLVGSILGLAWRDYFMHSAFQRDWRQLYYVAVYASFFLAFGLHFLPQICCIADKNCYSAIRLKKTSLWIHVILLNLIPLLCIFAVHGVILITLNGIVLLGSYLYTLYSSVNTEQGSSNHARKIAIFLILITFFYMAADPIVYIDPSKGISPVWPIWQVAAFLCTLAIAILPLMLKSPEKTWRESFLDIVEGIKDDSSEYRYQFAIIGISALVLVFFAVYYQIKVYTYKEKEVFNMGFAEPRLEGFGGINIFSWCMIPVSLNIMASIASVVYISVKKELRRKKDASSN